MADLSDVISVLAAQVSSEIYPHGTSSPPIAGDVVSVMEGWPLPPDLDGIVTAFNGGTPSSNVLVSVYPRPGYFRNTSRYPSKWQEISRPTATLTLTLGMSGTSVTVGGAAPGSAGPPQNVALEVGFGSGTQAFVYPTTSGDTLNTIADNLAALINAATPATAAGAVINIPAAYSITARIGVTGVVAQELRRQEIRVDVNVWAPSPPLRDQIGQPIRVALANFDYLTMPDGFAARIRACDDHWLDDPEKAGLYRRQLGYDIEYPTTQSMPAAEIIVFQASMKLGQAPILAVPPPPTIVISI